MLRLIAEQISMFSCIREQYVPHLLEALNTLSQTQKQTFVF